ncbi:ATP-binding protein [Novispirillum sp. DQ9]|uniref:ATP-binding protein n=1 Tax=Novispirillum sp. DQ9 TaxID=3398612 RepID=UPI003C7C5170
MGRGLLFLLMLVVAALIGPGPGAGGVAAAVDAGVPRAVGGVVDARDWHFADPLALAGEWRAAWKTLIAPMESAPFLDSGPLVPAPGMWNEVLGEGDDPGFGYATFGLRVLLPRYSSGLALRVPEINSALRLYVNGQLVLTRGRVGVAPDLEVPAWQMAVVPLPQGDQLDILLQVSNHAHWEGGVGRAILLGRADPMLAERDRKVAADLLLAGAVVMIGLYVLALWVQRREPEYLLFVGLAACVGLRVVAVGRLPVIGWPEVPGEWLLRGEYLGLFMFLGLYPAFVGRLFPGEVVKPVNRVLLAVAALAVPMALFAPPALFTQLRMPFAYGVLGVMFYAVGVAALAVLRRRPGAGLLTASLLVLAGGVTNDVLHFQRIIDTTDVAAIAFALFMLGHALVLGQRMNGAFVAVETLSRHLGDLNRGLEERVAEVTRGLREGRDRLHAILANVPDGVLTVDEAGQVESFSPAAERLFGRTAAEVVGRPVAGLFEGAGAAEALDRLFGPVPPRTAGTEMEADGRRHDGRTFPVALSLSRATLNGRPAGVITVRDVTQRRQAEAALARAKEEAEDAAAARAEYLATMSHEIRTPLNGMLGMVELLRGTSLDPSQRDYVETINYSGGALLTILDDVLDASRLEAGRLSLDSTVFHLPRLVRSVTDLMTPRASAKGLRVRLDVPPDVPAQVVGDPMRLRQVLLNLVSNAVKFTESGEVAVLVAVDLVGERQGRFRFTVRDTGIGIPDAARAALFSRFAQADASVARRYGGSGLGLFICQRIVALMGGAIDVHSVSGTGTTFTVTVPLGIERRAEVRPDTAEVMDVPPLRVLLVEDVEVNQRVAIAFLRNQGHEVEVASSGLEAERRLREDDPFDLVLMDIRLPDIDGTEVTARLRALGDPVRAETPVLALTANVFPEDVERYLAAGMNGVVPKPIQVEQFRRAVAVAVLGHDPSPAAEAPEQEPWPRERAPALDVAFVDDRLAGLGQGGFLPILTLGRRSVTAAAEDVARLAADGPADELAKAAHRLAGAASNFGFARLFTLGRTIERLVEDGADGLARSEARQVPEALAETLAALDAWLSARSLPEGRPALPLQEA